MFERAQAPDDVRQANWIWGGENPRSVNAFRLFRKEFVRHEDATDAQLYIFAEARYKLYLNGRFIQLGPTPCQPEHRLWDVHDVTPHIRQGANCIAVLAYSPGIMTGQFTLSNPGLICALQITGGSETTQILTDISWKTLDPAAWVTPALLCPYAKGFHEWHLAARMPSGWNDIGFDDSRWADAIDRPFYPFADFMELNDTGSGTLMMILPQRLAGCGLGDGIVTPQMKQAAVAYYASVKNRERRLMGYWILDRNAPLPADEPLPAPVAHLAALEKRSFPAEPVARQAGCALFPIEIDTSRPGDPFLTFDLGEVQSGLFTLALDSDSGGTVDIAWDDRINPDGTVPLMRATPNCDRVEVPAGSFFWEGFFERGARYLQLMLRGFQGQVVLRSLGIRETLLPVPPGQTADFSSDNSLLDSIWRASVNTMRQYRNGCGSGDPERERCHWFGDDFMALRMAFYWCGDWTEMRRALELTAQSQYADGSFPVVSPGHFEDFNMVGGSCSWAASVCEYCATTGDLAFGHRILPQIRRHIDYELRFADPDGLLYETPGRRFLSWADGEPRPPYKPGETWAKKDRKPWGDFFDPPTCGYNAIINIYWLWCLRETARLAASVGDMELAGRCKAIFSRGRPAFDRLFHDPASGLYRDNVAFKPDGSQNEPSFCESTLFFLMKTRLIEMEQALACYDQMQQPDFLCCRSSGGLELGSAAAFLLDAGRYAEALALYLDRWGAPVLAGATTMGEEFYRSDGNSDCHIHGATPARDFLEYLAGIRLSAPLWQTVTLVPPYGLRGLSFKAQVPAQGNLIKAEVVCTKEAALYRYSVPENCTCRLRLPDRSNTDAPRSGEVRL